MVAAFALSAAAQVTGSGTTGSVPVFTSTTAVGDSPIKVSGSNIGIGTTSPSNSLQVNIGTANGGFNQGMSIVSGDGTYTTGAGGMLQFQNENMIIGGVRAARTSNGLGGQLQFYTHGGTNGNTFGTSFLQRMVIDTTGNVGIGTTTPQSVLQVMAGNNPPTSSGNMNTGVIISSAAGDAALNMGASDNGSTLRYSWINSAFVNNSGIGSSLVLQQNGGNVGIGTTSPAAPLEVNGIIKLTASSGGYIIFQDGTTQSTAFNPAICGGDYAESVDVTGNRTSYEPGDVLVIDPGAPGKFLKANQPYSTLVAGIYSTKPGTVGRRQAAAKSPDEVPMAMVGIVPTKVSAENGPIHTGDLLVASSTPGRAMKGTDRSLLTGAVIGKALGNLDSGTGVIEVLVTLQ